MVTCKLAQRSAVSCAICPYLFLRNFLIGNSYLRADGDGAMEFSLLEQFHGSTASSRERYLVRQVNVDLHRILIVGTFAAQLKSD